MTPKGIISAFAAIMLLSATAGEAVTYSNISGVVHENLVAPGAPAAGPGQVLGDFGTNPNDAILEIVGDTVIYGGLAHANTARNQYVDAWIMDFGTGVYDVDFAWAGTTGGSFQPFDGSLTVNGVRTDLGQSGTLLYRGLTGPVTFVFNPIDGVSTPREQARFTMTASEVPLPGAGLFMLGALGALVWRRRTVRASTENGPPPKGQAESGT